MKIFYEVLSNAVRGSHLNQHGFRRYPTHVFSDFEHAKDGLLNEMQRVVGTVFGLAIESAPSNGNVLMHATSGKRAALAFPPT